MRIDCSNIKNFYNEKKVMCNNYECIHCPIKIAMRGTGYINCHDWIVRNIGEAIKIVQEWSDNHRKTLRDMLLLHFPTAKMKMLYSQQGVCAGNLFGFDCPNTKTCEECWNTIV